MPNHIGRLLALIGLLCMIGAALSTRAANAEEQRCFSQTGFCISGRFRAFWEQNGGLPVFGYPIGSAQIEVNHEDGQSYLTQWFERNRFELHPQNTPPFDVLLGRLGDDRLRQQGRDWSMAPRERGPKDGCLWFEQTGHNVCDQAAGRGFKAYWEQHGLQLPKLEAYHQSLALFGFPLTEATLEVNPTDGRSYLTQWFERPRFEWHPDEPDAYKVLLGLLGNEIRGAAGAQYLWPTTLPHGLVIVAQGSGADATGFELMLADPSGGQFTTTIRGGPTHVTPQAHGRQSVTIRGQAGVAFTTGAGYSLYWIEGDWPYQISGGLGLDEALQLANGLQALSLDEWRQRARELPASP